MKPFAVGPNAFPTQKSKIYTVPRRPQFSACATNGNAESCRISKVKELFLSADPWKEWMLSKSTKTAWMERESSASTANRLPLAIGTIHQKPQKSLERRKTVRNSTGPATYVKSTRLVIFCIWGG